MKIKCSNEGLLCNFELLEILRERTHELGKTPLYPQPHDPFPTELQCYEMLLKTPARFQSIENVSAFITSVKPIALTSVECLKLINLKPMIDVEIHLVWLLEYVTQMTEHFLFASLWKVVKDVWQETKSQICFSSWQICCETRSR